METMYTISVEESSESMWTVNTSSTMSPDDDSDDYTSLAPYRVSVTLWRVFSPIILVMGTFGNSMTLLILRTMPLGSASVSVFFSALAISDLVLLYTGLLRRWILSLSSLEIRNLHDVLCRLHMFLVYLTGMTSAWFLVAMTMQRVTSVLWPHRVAVLCTQRRSQMTVAVIVVILVAFNLPLPLTYTLTRTENGPGGGRDSIAVSAECILVADPDLIHFDSYVYPWIDLVLTSLLPSALLVLGNSALSVTLFRSLRQVRRMTTTPTTPITPTITSTSTSHHDAGPAESQPRIGTSKREKAASSLTVTLISVSVTYLCLTLPICVYALVSPYLVETDARQEAWLELVWVVSNLLWYSNSAVNFYLYCLTGSKFRAQCRHLLLCGLCRRGAAGREAARRAVSCVVSSKTSQLQYSGSVILRPEDSS